MAVTEECEAVTKQTFDSEMDDLEKDFYKDCTSTCSSMAGTTKNQLPPVLDISCLRKPVKNVCIIILK